MAERILSIEIGYSLTKVCEIDNSSKTPKIFNSFVIATPEDMVHDGAVEVNDLFINQFQRMMTSKGIKTRKAIFTVSSNKIATREAVIPYVKDKQIIPVVRANLSDYFPVQLNQYVFSHSVIEVIREDAKGAAAEATPTAEAEHAEAQAPDAKNTKKSVKAAKASIPVKPLGKPTGLKLLVLAAPKQLIQSYERLAKATNLELVTIDYNGNSIYQAAKEECKKGVQLIIKIDERSTLLMVLEDDVIALNRTIPYGIDEAVSALMQTKELGDASSYEKALDIARRKTVILSSFDNDSMFIDLANETKEGAIKAERRAVTDALRPLVGGIIRVIDYYNSNHTSRPIEKMFVTGIGADFSGISNLLSHEAGLKIKNLTHLTGIDIEKVFKDVTYGEYVACIGASIAPIEFYPDHADEKSGKGSKGGSKSNVNTLLIALIVLFACVVGSIIMILATMIPYLKEKKLNQEYYRTIEELQPSYDIYLQYQQALADNEYLKMMDDATRNRNEEMIDFIADLEKRMPSTFCVNSMEADTEKITISVTVSSKDEVAYIVDGLKEHSSFASVELTSVTFQENDLGEYEYAFDIELYYAPYEDELEETEEVL